MNTVQPGIGAGADVGHGKVLVEHLTDDPTEHGPDVDGHDDSLSGASSLDVPAQRSWGPSTNTGRLYRTDLLTAATQLA